MKPETAFLMVKVAGVALALLGVALIVTLGPMPVLGPIYTLFGVIAVVAGIYVVRKAARLEKRMQARRRRYEQGLYAVLALMVAGGIVVASATHCAACSTTCYTFYQRVVYMEYLSLGMTLVVGFLALAPLLLARTSAGAFFQEISQLAGSMLVILIAMLLLVYPLDVIFVVQNQATSTATGVTTTKCCYVDLRQLDNGGPPLLRIIYDVLNPPAPQFSLVAPLAGAPPR